MNERTEADSPALGQPAQLDLLLRQVVEHLRGIRQELAGIKAVLSSQGQAAFAHQAPEHEPAGPYTPAEEPPPPPLADGQPSADLAKLIAELERVDGGAAWLDRGRLRAARDPEEAAAALAGLLRQGAAAVPKGALGPIRDWVCDHETAALNAGLEVFAAEKGPAVGLTPELRLGDGPERPGLRLDDVYLLPPVLYVQPSRRARLVQKVWNEKVPRLSWEDLLSLARADRPADAALLALLEWAEGQPAHRQAVLEALRDDGVRLLEQPEGGDTASFVQAPIYRKQGGREVIEPAVVREDAERRCVLRPGRLRVATPEKPPAARFMEWELGALVDDMRRRPGRYLRIDDTSTRPVGADDTGAHLGGLVEQFRQAEAREARRGQAEAFGRFYQEVLRVCPEPHEEPSQAWQERQREFRTAAGQYLEDLNLQAVQANPGHDSWSHRDNYHRLGRPRGRGPYNPGQVAEMRAPALRYQAGGEEPLLLKGTLYFVLQT